MRKETARLYREKAQDELMDAMVVRIEYQLEDRYEEPELTEIRNAAIKEAARIARMFGYRTWPGIL